MSSGAVSVRTSSSSSPAVARRLEMFAEAKAQQQASSLKHIRVTAPNGSVLTAVQGSMPTSLLKGEWSAPVVISVLKQLTRRRQLQGALQCCRVCCGWQAAGSNDRNSVKLCIALCFHQRLRYEPSRAGGEQHKYMHMLVVVISHWCCRCSGTVQHTCSVQAWSRCMGRTCRCAMARPPPKGATNPLRPPCLARSYVCALRRFFYEGSFASSRTLNSDDVALIQKACLVFLRANT
jgi:hypothetical protein